MRWIRTTLREIFGLFVEDGSFAIAILAWLGIVWLLVPHLGIVSPWSGVILFVGLASILVENALRYAARSGRTKSRK